MGERFIPGTNPAWGRELPEDMDNSLVDKNGYSYDNGYNFDEFDEEAEAEVEKKDEQPKDSTEMLDNNKIAEKIRDIIIYTGTFVDANELYQKYPPKLDQPTAEPHVTAVFRPQDDAQLHLGDLGAEVRITPIGYANNGMNEGILVKCESDDQNIQTVLDGIRVPHITLSCSKDGNPVDTGKLEFELFDEPDKKEEIKGYYGIFVGGRKNSIIKSTEELLDYEEEMKNEAPRPILGVTLDNAIVRDRSDNSHFHPEGGFTMEKLDRALSRIDTKNRGGVMKEIITFDEVIGDTNCVEINESDDVVMVYRKNRAGMTPMVKNRTSEPCNSVTLILAKDRKMPDDKNYVLITGYIGSGAPREPWDKNIDSEEERQESEDFWAKHALLYNEDLIDWGRTSKEDVA